MYVCMPRYPIYSYICVIYMLYTHKLRRLCIHQYLEQHLNTCNQKPAHHRSRYRLSKRINPPEPQLRKSLQPSVPPNLQTLFRKYKHSIVITLTLFAARAFPSCAQSTPVSPLSPAPPSLNPPPPRQPPSLRACIHPCGDPPHGGDLQRRPEKWLFG
jgi:hypothetical protein